MIRVLIVAPYLSVRAGLHALLAGAEECALIGAVSGSAELAALLPETRPDVVLLDDSAGEGARVVELLSGREVALVILIDWPTASVPPAGFPILREDALPGWAYLPKEAGGEEIAAALHAAAAGLVALDRALLPLLTARASGLPGSPDLPGSGEDLTQREREVLRLMAEGLQNRQIAGRLYISPHTVKFHVASILAKLGAASRTEAVTLAARRGHLIL